jgi:hypothetical protein
MLKALRRRWLVVARKIGYVQSQLILTLVYFVVIAPFAMAVRAFTDPLGLHTSTSWRWLSDDTRSDSSLSAVRQQF